MPNTFDIWTKHFEPLFDKVETGRRDSYLSAFEGVADAPYFINTGKPEKAEAQFELIFYYTGMRLLLDETAFLYDNADQEEIKSPEATEVAQWKALQALRYGRSIQGDSRNEVIAAGADVNAFVIGPNGEITQEHKYSRLDREVLRVNREKNRDSIIKTYATPPNGLVRVRWNLGTTFINGQTHQFGDQIEIASDAVDQELLMQAMNEAEANGLWESSNLHLAAIETLRENGKIKNVALLPQELRARGVTLEQVKQAPTNSLVDTAQYSILTNVPIRYQH